MSHRVFFFLLPCVLAGLTAVADAPVKPSTLELYRAKCQQCHMADGNSPIENLTFVDGKWTRGSKPAEVERVIAEGVPGTPMLPFKVQLTPAQIKDLAVYVRSFDKSLTAQKVRK